MTPGLHDFDDLDDYWDRQWDWCGPGPPDPPEPSDEELCAAYTAHAYDGKDAQGPRCHCGLRRTWASQPPPSEEKP